MAHFQSAVGNRKKCYFVLQLTSDLESDYISKCLEILATKLFQNEKKTVTFK